MGVGIGSTNHVHMCCTQCPMCRAQEWPLLAAAFYRAQMPVAYHNRLVPNIVEPLSYTLALGCSS